MNCKSAYPDRMGKPPPIRAVLAANLRALMSRQHPEMTEHELARLAKRHGGELSQSTVHWMLHGQTSCGVDHLATLAMVFELEPWQLLVPDLDPTDPPVLASVSKRLEAFQATLRQQSDEIATLRRQLRIKD